MQYADPGCILPSPRGREMSRFKTLSYPRIKGQKRMLLAQLGTKNAHIATGRETCGPEGTTED